MAGAVEAQQNAAFGRLRQKLQRLGESRIVRRVMELTFREHKNRIFVRGRQSKARQIIGRYGTKPISISKKNQARSTGKTFFPGGYKQYRQLAGLDSSKVILVNKGNLRDAYQLVQRGGQFMYVFKDNKSALIAEGNEKRFNAVIFKVSQEELRRFRFFINAEIRRILR